MFYENQIIDQTYQVIREIGKGGAGVVFLAYHLRLQKYVVLKQISKNGFANISRTEVDTLKSLHHPNLPQVYDFLEMGNYVYTVMDYIEGYDLQQYIKTETAIPTDCLVRWYRQLTEVLIYLHSQNPAVIHSDIKPGNIIITPENNAVLIDFNVSVSYQPDTLIGISVNYASPEQISLMQDQAMGNSTIQIDGRSDIYSLGATFYHLMSMIQPSLFYGIQPLSSLGTDYPEIFIQIIDKAMEQDREKRYQSASEMLRAIDGMWRKTAAFKGYIAAQIGVILISAALIAAGAFQLIHGVRVDHVNRYDQAYNSCIQNINSGDYSTAITESLSFLEEYEKDLEKDIDRKKEILMGVARSCYEQGSYSNAADYYIRVIGAAGKNDEDLIDCYVGAICSYVKNGNADKAAGMIQRAEDEGLSEIAIKLLKVQLASIQGNETECIAGAGELISADDDIAVRASIAAGEVCSKQTDRLSWLKNAEKYLLDNKNIINRASLLRQVGYRCLELWVQSERQSNIEKDSIDTAKEAYFNIPISARTVNDYYNLATIYRLEGLSTMAIETLEELENSKILFPKRGILYMHKAFAYDELGDSNNAKDCVKKAIDAGLAEKDVSQMFWEQFSTLKQKYNN